MKILVFGDIYGRIGRASIKKELPILKEKYKPDFIIANVDNITSGRGPIEKLVLDMEEIGIDLMTGGDHIFDNFDKIEDYLKKEDSNLLIPANLYNSKNYNFSNKGYKILEKNGKRLLVIHLLGEVFMKFNVNNPFLKVEEILDELKGEKLDGIILDFHKEVSSEGYGMGHFLDGKISMIYGTHTHIQTNDDNILPNGTGIISDVGMIGTLNSIIGADFESVKNIFLTGINKGKMKQSLDKNYQINGIFVEIGNNLKCEKIEKIRIKGML